MKNKARGWVAIYRSLLESDEWLAMKGLAGGYPRPCAWIDLIGLANHKDGHVRPRFDGLRVPVLRGQVGWSIKKLAERWGWSTTKVRCFFLQLSDDKQIVTQKNNITSIVTIINYDEYQFKDTQNVTQETRRSTAEVTQKYTNNNEEELNNEEEVQPPSSPEEDQHLLQVPMTETEKQWLMMLKGIELYPLDPPKDLNFLRGKEAVYPDIDVLSMLRGWADYKLTEKLTPKSRVYSQLGNQFDLARKYNKHKRANGGNGGSGPQRLDAGEQMKEDMDNMEQKQEDK